MTGSFAKLNALLARHVPEQRIYLRTGTDHTVLSATPVFQAVCGVVIALSVCWTVIATSA